MKTLLYDIYQGNLRGPQGDSILVDKNLTIEEVAEILATIPPDNTLHIDIYEEEE